MDERSAANNEKTAAAPAHPPVGGVAGPRDVEESLRRSESRLRLAVDALELALWDVDLTDGTVEESDRFVQLLGLPPHVRHTKADEWERYVHPEDLERARAKFNGAIAGTCEYEDEQRLVGADGVTRWVFVKGNVVRDAAGRAVRMVGVCRDITGRKRTEQAVRDSEAQFRLLADAMPQIVWAAAPDGQVEYYNRQWYQYTGASAERRGDESWNDIVHPDDLDRVRAAWADAIARRRPHEIECRLRWGVGGSYRWFLTRAVPIYDPQGALIRWIGTNTDIQDRKLAEQRLREESAVIETTNAIGRTLAAELDMQTLVQAVTDATTKLSRAQFGAFFYNVADPKGGVLSLYTLSGAPREAFAGFGHPRATPIFGPTMRGERVVRSDDITADPRYAQNAPHRGMPAGHLPVRSYLAVPVVARSGEVLGGLFFGHPEAGIFTDRDERAVVGIAAQAAIAIDNARLYEALRSSKTAAERNLAQLQAVFGSMHEGVVLIGPDGELLEWNPAALRIHGYARGDEVRTNIVDLADVFELTTLSDGRIVPFDEWPANRTVRGEQFAAFEVRLYRRDTGREALVSYSGTPVHDGEGNFVLGVMTLRDVTDERRAQVALRQSEDRYARATAAGRVGVWELNLADERLYLAPSLKAILGYDEQDLPSRLDAWDALVHPDDRERMRAALQAYLEGITPAYVIEVRRRHRQGGYRWMLAQATALRAADGRPYRLIGSDTDITERKQVEAALQESEARLQLAIAIAQMGTFEIDLVTDAVSVNETGRLIYGWPADEPLTFAKVQTHFHPDDRDGVLATVGAAMEPDGPGGFEVEQRIVRVDGVVRWIRVRGRVTFSGPAGQRRPMRCTGTYIDITEHKEAEQRRERMLEAERAARSEAERSSRMKDEFLSTVSHELRTPLNAILGWSQIIRRPTSGDAEVKKGLEVIERNARAQAQIIEDLLDMSRIVSGKLRLDLRPVDLNAIIEAATTSLRPAADAKGIRIESLLNPMAGPVSGDGDRLQQVVWNLLSNAVKFTPRGGSVTVTLERAGPHVEICVADTGEGIEAEFLPHVFERFRQAEGSTTRRHGGLGLGLAIVKQLVELHGGTIYATSPGKGLGATFCVVLPLASVASSGHGRPGRGADASMARAADVDLRGIGVLVVDDDADALGLMRQLLEDGGATVTTAATADQAIDCCRTARFDVIVSDIGMPDRDGYDFVRELRALSPGAGGRTPAVALTAMARAEDRTRALVSGFDMHMPKPVDPAELCVVVARLAKRDSRG